MSFAQRIMSSWYMEDPCDESSTTTLRPSLTSAARRSLSPSRVPMAAPTKSCRGRHTRARCGARRQPDGRASAPHRARNKATAGRKGRPAHLLVFVLGGHGEVTVLFQVIPRREGDELVILVDDGQLSAADGSNARQTTHGERCVRCRPQHVRRGRERRARGVPLLALPHDEIGLCECAGLLGNHEVGGHDL